MLHPIACGRARGRNGESKKSYIHVTAYCLGHTVVFDFDNDSNTSEDHIVVQASLVSVDLVTGSL